MSLSPQSIASGWRFLATALSIAVPVIGKVECEGQGTHFPIGPDSHVQRILPNDGLLAGEIAVVYQDRRGFMWFGAVTGLSRYDGFEFVNYVHEPTAPNSITAGPVWCIAEDDKANLWIGTQDGLNYYDRELETFERFNIATHENGLYSNAIKSIQPNADGTLWIGTLGESLHLFNPDTNVFEHYYFEGPHVGSERPVDYISVVRSDRHDRLWVGTGGSGALLGSKGDTFIPIQQTRGSAADQRRINEARVTDFLFNEDGSVIVATEKGFFQVRESTQQGLSFKIDPTLRPIFEELKDVYLQSLLRDSNGNIWFGTDGEGAFTLNPSTGQYQQLTKRLNPSSLASAVVRDIYEDRSGDLWFSHYPRGVSHIGRAEASFTVVGQSSTPGKGLTNPSVTAFEEDDKGNLWIATDGGGINYWNRNEDAFTAYTPNDSSNFSAPGALSIELDQQQSLWVGTWDGGLNRLDRGKSSFKTYLPEPTNPTSLSSPHVFCVLEDSYGVLWAATMNGGLNRYRPEIDGFDHYYTDVNDPTSINGNLVWVLYEDRDKRLWVGTNSGFNLYDRTHDHFVSYTLPKNDSHQPITWVSTFLMDSQSHLWVGTLGAGLHEFVPDKGFIRHFSSKDGLSGDRICGILEDESKNLWISTFNGITRLDTESGKMTIYDESNGLPGRQFNRFTAHKRIGSEELLFGTTEGMLIINPSQLDSVPSPPPVIFTRLRLDNQLISPTSPQSPLKKSISETDRLELDWGFSLIEIQFAALNYRTSTRNSFEFYMEGVDQDWRKSGKNQSASYANLDPGHYKFMVRAANYQGIWNSAGKSLEIIVHPPLWKRLWFQTLVALLSVGGILGVG